MTRSSDYINNLPPELLTRVFDDLDFDELIETSTVCTRWFEILSGNRFIARHRLLLSPELLDEEKFDNLNRFRSVKIRLKYFSENHHLKLLQYLLISEAVQMLEELDIKFGATSWNTIFETGLDLGLELKLPNLHTLHFFVPIDSDVGQTQCRIVAPKLKTLHQNSITDGGPLELFKDQIEKLVVDFREKGHFLSTALGLSFANLRSLTLNTHYDPYSLYSINDTDFHSGYKAIFKKLDHLKISDYKESFAAVYSLIIRELKNVKSLEIYGGTICQDTFSGINQLKQLNELVLMVTIETNAASPNDGLSLPNLTKLTTFIKSMAPLASLPNLKALTIANHENNFRISHTLREVEIAMIRSLGQQLESFEFVNVEFNDSMIDQICTLTDLRALSLKYVDVEPPGLFRIFSCLQNLKRARFTECRLIKHVVYRSKDCDSDCDADDFWRDVCAKLAEINVACTIAATGGRILVGMTMSLQATSPEELFQELSLSDVI